MRSLYGFFFLECIVPSRRAIFPCQCSEVMKHSPLTRPGFKYYQLRGPVVMEPTEKSQKSSYTICHSRQTQAITQSIWKILNSIWTQVISVCHSHNTLTSQPYQTCLRGSLWCGLHGQQMQKVPKMLYIWYGNDIFACKWIIVGFHHGEWMGLVTYSICGLMMSLGFVYREPNWMGLERRLFSSGKSCIMSYGLWR